MLRTNTLRAGALVSVLLLQALPAQAAHWTCYTYIPNTEHIVFKMMRAIGEDLERATDGEVQVSCHPGGSLSISAPDTTLATADGVVQLAGNAFTTGSVPLVGLFSLPGLFMTEDELKTGMRIADPYFTKALGDLNLVYLGSYYYPQQAIFSVEQVRSLTDLRGKKIRVNTTEQSVFVTRVGATPVTIATPEVAQALQLGAMSTVLSAASGGARYWTDFLNYNFTLGPNYTVSPLFVNKDAFEALTPKQQQKLREVARVQADKASHALAEENATLLEQFRKNGMTVTIATPEDDTEIYNLSKSYWPQWAAERGPQAEALLAEIRETLNK